MIRIAITFVILILTLGYFISDFKHNYLTEKKATASPSTMAVPTSPTPFPSPSPLPSLPPLPLLSKASSMQQTIFKQADFPFEFSYPAYFELEKTNIADAKAQTLTRNPQYKWTMIAQTLVGVPFSGSYSYSNCTNMARITISKFSNSDNKSLYEFIKSQYSTYPGNGVTETFETYQKGLTSIDLPRPKSYQFEGIIGENNVKTIFFEYGDAFYSFYLSGGCNTGEGFSSDADTFFLSLLRSLKFN